MHYLHSANAVDIQSLIHQYHSEPAIQKISKYGRVRYILASNPLGQISKSWCQAQIKAAQIAMCENQPLLRFIRCHQRDRKDTQEPFTTLFRHMRTESPQDPLSLQTLIQHYLEDLAEFFYCIKVWGRVITLKAHLPQQPSIQLELTGGHDEGVAARSRRNTYATPAQLAKALAKNIDIAAQFFTHLQTQHTEDTKYWLWTERLRHIPAPFSRTLAPRQLMCFTPRIQTIETQGSVHTCASKTAKLCEIFVYGNGSPELAISNNSIIETCTIRIEGRPQRLEIDVSGCKKLQRVTLIRKTLWGPKVTFHAKPPHQLGWGCLPGRITHKYRPDWLIAIQQILYRCLECVQQFWASIKGRNLS